MSNNERAFRYTCIALSVLFLAAAFICGLADDTPDVWLYVSLLGAAGVFAWLRV